MPRRKNGSEDWGSSIVTSNVGVADLGQASIGAADICGAVKLFVKVAGIRSDAF